MNEVVGLLTALGEMWNIPTTNMGLIFLAWANCGGDLVVDISLAKIGKANIVVSPFSLVMNQAAEINGLDIQYCKAQDSSCIIGIEYCISSSLMQIEKQCN